MVRHRDDGTTGHRVAAEAQHQRRVSKEHEAQAASQFDRRGEVITKSTLGPKQGHIRFDHVDTRDHDQHQHRGRHDAKGDADHHRGQRRLGRNAGGSSTATSRGKIIEDSVLHPPAPAEPLPKNKRATGKSGRSPTTHPGRDKPKI